MKKKAFGKIIAIAMLIGLFSMLSLTSLAAPADPYENLTVNFFNGTANICIEGNSGTSSAGGTIDLWTWWSNSWYYAWRLVPDANHEYFQIRRQTSATATATTALAPTGGTVAAGTRLTLAAASNTADNQWWKLERQSNGRYLITSKANASLCLAPISAASGQGIQLSTVPATLATSDTWRILVHSTSATAASQLVSADQPLQSAASLANITVPAGTAVGALGLPERVDVTYAGGTTGNLAVIWDTSTYNGNAAGTYALVGTLQLNGLASQPATPVAAGISVIVESSAEPIDYSRPTYYTAEEGNIARLESVRQLTNTTETKYNPLTGAGIERPGINVSYYSTYGTPTAQTLRATDGIVPTGATSNGYLSWNFAASTDPTFAQVNYRLYWILNWGEPYTIDGVRVDWWTDSNVTVPTQSGIQWLDGDVWRDVTGLKNPLTGATLTNSLGTAAMNSPAKNPAIFDKVTTTQLRLWMYRSNTNGNMGMGEWEVFGTPAGGPSLIHAAYPTITTQPLAKTVEVDETATLTVAATVTKGILSYQWYSGNAPGVLIPGATGTTFNAPTTTAGITNYFCMITNTDDEATGSKTATVTSQVVTVTVNGDTIPGQPEVEEVRIISNNMIELHWKVHTKYTGTQQAYRYSDGHPDTLTGAGSSLNFHRTQTTHRDNFEIKLDGAVRNQPASSSNSASPYYWHADNYLLHQVRMNQHVTTLRMSTSLTGAQMTALENGTSKITVQIVGDVTNRAGVAADKTKIYEAIWKPYYDKQVVAKTGLTIKGSQYVDIRTVQKAADITDVIMSAMPQAVVNMISSQGAFLLFGPGEHSGNIPEQRVVISYDEFNRAEGYGGSNAATSAANVERCNVVVSGVTNNPVDYYPAGYRSGYQHESILAHEFGHKIQTAFNSVYASTHPLRQEFTSAFSQVTSRTMWTPYVRDASGGSEYFATMTSVWYNGMSEGNAANCNTRDEFFRYDRRGYDFFSKLYSLDKIILSPDWANCPNTAAPNYNTGSALSNTTYQTRAISTIAPQTALTVPVGTAVGELTLPAKVQLSFADSFSTAPLAWTSAYGLDYYPVVWDTTAFDGDVAGAYTLFGTVSHTYVGKYTGDSYIADTIVNPDNVKASLTVVVEDAAPADQPEIEEVRIINNNMIELHWKVHTKYTGSQAAYRYSDGHPDTLTGAGSSLNFHSTQNNHSANFRVQLDGVTINQRTGTFSPYYWHADNYSLHQVRMNQHVSTLRLSSNLSSSQMTALESGASRITVQIIGDVTNRAGTAADKTKVYTAIWKPYYDKEIVAKTGLAIKGSQYVDIRTVQKAADITDVIMSAMPQEVVNRISSQGAFLLFGPGEHSGNIPEQRNVITYDQFNRAEGYGGSNAATSAANVERCNVVVSGVTNNPVDYYPAGYRSGYQHESILAHEFGHKIQTAFNSVYASTHPLRQEFTDAFRNVTSRVMWTPYVRDTSSGGEYFATMTSVWYNGMSEGNAANCNTRDEFFRYDRKGYDFFAKLFSLDKTILSADWANCPNTAAPTWATGSAEPFATYQVRAIGTIAPQTAITVPTGTVADGLGLPAKVQLSFADSFSTAPLSWTSPYGLDYYPVTWDTSAFDGTVAGTYTILGTVSHTYVGKYTGDSYTTSAIVNPDNVKASIVVTVEGAPELLTDGEIVKRFVVDAPHAAEYTTENAYTVHAFEPNTIETMGVIDPFFAKGGTLFAPTNRKEINIYVIAVDFADIKGDNYLPYGLQRNVWNDSTGTNNQLDLSKVETHYYGLFHGRQALTACPKIPDYNSNYKAMAQRMEEMSMGRWKVNVICLNEVLAEAQGLDPVNDVWPWITLNGPMMEYAVQGPADCEDYRQFARVHQSGINAAYAQIEAAWAAQGISKELDLENMDFIFTVVPYNTHGYRSGLQGGSGLDTSFSYNDQSMLQRDSEYRHEPGVKTRGGRMVGSGVFGVKGIWTYSPSGIVGAVTTAMHEFTHGMGMFDDYSYGGLGTNSGEATASGAGSYGVMGSSMNSSSPDLPVWRKYRMGWIDDDELMVVLPGDTVTVNLRALGSYEGDGGSYTNDPGIKTRMVVIPKEWRTRDTFGVNDTTEYGYPWLGNVWNCGWNSNKMNYNWFDWFTNPWVGGETNAIKSFPTFYTLETRKALGLDSTIGTNATGVVVSYIANSTWETGHGAGGFKIATTSNNGLKANGTFTDPHIGLTVRVNSSNIFYDNVTITYTGVPTSAAQHTYLGILKASNSFVTANQEFDVDFDITTLGCPAPNDAANSVSATVTRRATPLGVPGGVAGFTMTVSFDAANLEYVSAGSAPFTYVVDDSGAATGTLTVTAIGSQMIDKDVILSLKFKAKAGAVEGKYTVGGRITAVKLLNWRGEELGVGGVPGFNGVGTVGAGTFAAFHTNASNNLTNTYISSFGGSVTVGAVPTYTISGAIVCDTPGPAFGTNIGIESTVQVRSGSTVLGTAKSDYDGNYTIKGIPAGTGYTIYATKAKYNAATSAAFNVTADTKAPQLMLARQTFTVSGTVSGSYNSDGSGATPLVGVDVYLINTGSANSVIGGPVKTNASGAYTVSGLEVGRAFAAVAVSVKGTEYEDLYLPQMHLAPTIHLPQMGINEPLELNLGMKYGENPADYNYPSGSGTLGTGGVYVFANTSNRTGRNITLTQTQDVRLRMSTKSNAVRYQLRDLEGNAIGTQASSLGNSNGDDLVRNVPPGGPYYIEASRSGYISGCTPIFGVDATRVILRNNVSTNTMDLQATGSGQTLAGTVYNAITRLPIEDVKIQSLPYSASYGAGVPIFSSATGTFSYLTVAAARDLIFTKEGYITQKVYRASGAASNLAIYLVPLPSDGELELALANVEKARPNNVATATFEVTNTGTIADYVGISVEGVDTAVFEEIVYIAADSTVSVPLTLIITPDIIAKAAAGEVLTFTATSLTNEAKNIVSDTIRIKDLISYDYYVYLESEETAVVAGESFFVSVVLDGISSYTMLTADIAYDTALFDYVGYTYLKGFVAAVTKPADNKVSVRSMPSMNMVIGEPSAGASKIVTFEFKAKGGFNAESVVSAFDIVALMVNPAGAVVGAITYPVDSFPVTISQTSFDSLVLEIVEVEEEVSELLEEETEFEEFVMEEEQFVVTGEKIVIIE